MDIDDNASTTKGDSQDRLRAKDLDFKQILNRLDAQYDALTSQVRYMRSDLLKVMRDVQNELLQAFDSFRPR